MFNFGAFAGGLATSIQKQQELNLQEEKYQQEITNAQNKLKQEEATAIKGALTEVKSHNNEVATIKNKMATAKDLDEYNGYVDTLNTLNKDNASLFQAAYDSSTNNAIKSIYAQAQFKPIDKAVATTIKDTNGNDKTVFLPEKVSEQKDNLLLMDNGSIGMRNIDENGKFSTVEPTNINPIKFKEDKESFANAIKVIDPNTNQPTMMLPKEYYRLKSEGKEPILYEKPDKGTSVEVKIDQQVAGNEKLYNELYALDENGNINDRKDVNRMKAVSGQLLSGATTEDKKAVGETKQLIATIPALQRLATTQDELAKKLNAIGGDTVVRKAVTSMAPYIGSNNKLMELAGMDEETIAKTLQLDTSSAKVIGDYAKAMSGLSLTDSQLQYYKNTVVGGDWMDYKTRALKTNQFIADEKKNIESRLKTYGDYMLPEKKQWEKEYGLNTKQEQPKAEATTKPLIIKATSRDELYQQIKAKRPDLSDSDINSYLKTKGY